jgi:hypothetical protein
MNRSASSGRTNLEIVRMGGCGPLDGRRDRSRRVHGAELIDSTGRPASVCSSGRCLFGPSAQLLEQVMVRLAALPGSTASTATGRHQVMYRPRTTRN